MVKYFCALLPWLLIDPAWEALHLALPALALFW
jgi:hypothetical protein